MPDRQQLLSDYIDFIPVEQVQSYVHRTFPGIFGRYNPEAEFFPFDTGKYIPETTTG
jgi:hypothetical protein